MARLVGIEICSQHVRAAVLQSQYRGFNLVAFRQVEIHEGKVDEALVLGLGEVFTWKVEGNRAAGGQAPIRGIESEIG